jgi:hypothetical protein
MTTFLCAISPHHSSEAPTERFLAEANNQNAALVAAFLHGLELEGLTPDPEVLRSAITQAMKDKQAPFRSGNEDDCGFVLWYRPDENNIGYGESVDGTEAGLLSRQNHWITIAEWRPDPARRRDLDGWSKEALIDHLLRMEAVQ